MLIPGVLLPWKTFQEESVSGLVRATVLNDLRDCSDIPVHRPLSEPPVLNLQEGRDYRLLRKRLQRQEKRDTFEQRLKEMPMPLLSLDTLSEKQIEALSVGDFLRAIKNTKSLDKLMLADNFIKEAERTVQLGINNDPDLKQFLRGIKTTGKISLYYSLDTYESVKETENGRPKINHNGRLKIVYRDAAGNRTTKTVRELTAKELTEALRRRKEKEQLKAGL
jgi:chaperonin cofactor prefoldin